MSCVTGQIGKIFHDLIVLIVISLFGRSKSMIGIMDCHILKYCLLFGDFSGQYNFTKQREPRVVHSFQFPVSEHPDNDHNETRKQTN